MLPKVKKGWIILIVAVFIFVLFNPSYSNFKEFTGFTGKKTEHLHKKYNFLLFSVYEDEYNEKKYLALLLNFIDITHKETKPVVETKVISDTTVVIVDVQKDSLPALKTTTKNSFDALDEFEEWEKKKELEKKKANRGNKK